MRGGCTSLYIHGRFCVFEGPNPLGTARFGVMENPRDPVSPAAVLCGVKPNLSPLPRPQCRRFPLTESPAGTPTEPETEPTALTPLRLGGMSLTEAFNRLLCFNIDPTTQFKCFNDPKDNLMTGLLRRFCGGFRDGSIGSEHFLSGSEQKMFWLKDGV